MINKDLRNVFIRRTLLTAMGKQKQITKKIDEHDYHVIIKNAVTGEVASDNKADCLRSAQKSLLGILMAGLGDEWFVKIIDKKHPKKYIEDGIKG